MEAGEGEELEVGVESKKDNQEETLEQQQQRHRNEKRLLQARIQQLKKTAGKPDKKKKKELDVQINKLEEDLRKTHLRESTALNNCHIDSDEEQPELEEPEVVEEPPPQPQNQKTEPRVSKAQRRREKKAASEAARTQEIADSEAAGAGAERIAETRVIQQALRKRGLSLWSISPDGNCLYSAVRHQLAAKGKSFVVRELRGLAADYIRAHRNDLSPFMCDPVTGDTLTDQQFECYCRDVSDTSSWGGQIELQALAASLKTAIHIVQAAAPGLIVQGEEYSKKGNVIVLTYHRHLYGLGEHYNSTRTLEHDDSPDE